MCNNKLQVAIVVMWTIMSPIFHMKVTPHPIPSSPLSAPPPLCLQKWKNFSTGNYLQELPCSNYLHDKKTWKPFKNHSVPHTLRKPGRLLVYSLAKRLNSVSKPFGFASTTTTTRKRKRWLKKYENLIKLDSYFAAIFQQLDHFCIIKRLLNMENVYFGSS